MHLDRIDFALIDALQKDANTSNKELAALVGLAPSSCLTRVRRLREDGVLRGAHEAIDPGSVGIGIQALVSVMISQHSRDVVESFRDYIVTQPEVIATYHLAGKYDYLVHVAVRDSAHLRDLTLEKFMTRYEVRRIETALIFDHTQTHTLPLYGADNDPA